MIFRIRAQGLVMNTSSTIDVGENEGEMAPIIEVEVEHCAAVIAAAFLDPSKQNSNSNSNSFCSINSQSRLIWIMIGLWNQPKSGKNRENIITRLTWVPLRRQQHLSICTEKLSCGIFLVFYSPTEWCVYNFHLESCVLADSTIRKS
jgi:hypothetical protein